MTTTSADTAAKKDVQKLQRAIVDGLEEVKAQEIEVFNTEHLSALFERVIIASGTSNRQTRALSHNVVDSVRKAGFSKPRVEGEENGEWIIVDCGAAVVHIMQPSIRQYYHLEEIWGGKPVRLKFGAPHPVLAELPPAAGKKPAAGKSKGGKTAPAKSAPAKAAQAKSAPAKSAPAKAGKPAPSRAAPSRSAAPARPASKTVVVKAAAKKAPARKTAPKKAR